MTRLWWKFRSDDVVLITNNIPIELPIIVPTLGQQVNSGWQYRSSLWWLKFFLSFRKHLTSNLHNTTIAGCATCLLVKCKARCTNDLTLHDPYQMTASAAFCTTLPNRIVCGRVCSFSPESQFHKMHSSDWERDRLPQNQWRHFVSDYKECITKVLAAFWCTHWTKHRCRFTHPVTCKWRHVCCLSLLLLFLVDSKQDHKIKITTTICFVFFFMCVLQGV